MGIRTGPGTGPFGDDCDCHEAGRTPQFVYVTVTGTKMCQWAINLGQIKAPNKTFMLEQRDGLPCSWMYEDDIWSVFYDAEVPGFPLLSLLEVVWNFAIGAAVFRGEGVACQTAFDNTHGIGNCAPVLVPGYDGQAQVFWLPTDNSPSIRGVMEKINMVPEHQTFTEAWPIDADDFAVRLARQQDATCIYIKYEHTL